MKRTTLLLALALLSTACSQRQSTGAEPSALDTPLGVSATRPSTAGNAPSAEKALKAGPRRFVVPVDGLPVTGGHDALVTIAAFTDYDCAYCARAEHTLHSLRAKYGADLRVAVAEYPLAIHEHARAAALTALAAEEQGRFEAMHDKLFEHPTEHESAQLSAFGAELGLGGGFDRARAGTSANAALARASALAASLNVRSTPTFFVNGRKIVGAQPMATFEVVVLEELNHARELLTTGVLSSEVYARVLSEARANPAYVDQEDANEPTAFVAETRTMGGAPLLGRRDAARTIVLFTDFECPYCAKLDARLRELTKKRADVRVVLRNHPLPMHAHARLAAKASIAADAQGRLEELSALLFANQSALDRDALVAYARRAGMNAARFERDLDAPETERRLAEDEALVTKLDVRGTPTSFVDGHRVVGAQSEATFDEVLARATK